MTTRPTTVHFSEDVSLLRIEITVAAEARA
jgi:hypothetical protein